MSAALMGAGVGLSLGAVYMAGGMARAATDHARAERVAQVAAGNFSETVLQREVADPTVLRLAQAHDPFGADDTAADRQVQLLADRLNARAAHPDAMQQARDLDCLTDAVYYEARGETVRGQQAVATVVLNRVKNPNFPKTVCGVVFQRAAGACQFSFACDGSMRRGREVEAWDDARKIAARALSGYVLRDVGSATHFHTLDVSPGWGPKMLRVATVGLHVFYRFNPHARDAIQAPEPQRAVFTSTDANLPPTLRIAAAMTVKSDASAPAAQPVAGKDAKAVVKETTVPQGVAPGIAKATADSADLKTAKADTTAS
ncbi:cell wall hydrolase [Phenylobacterium soli]|nr:cell wall hydrolase [Phenylobacterium soli]